MTHSFPATGRSADDIWSEISEMRKKDLDWRHGRAFSLVYDTGDHELEALLERVGTEFLHENALNPFRYETLLRMETDVIGFAADLFGASCGSMSSGGTESVFLAIQTARDHAAAERGIHQPRLVTCTTAHPAFAKACKYLGVELVTTEPGSDGRADVDAFAAAIDDRTIALVASTPCYPYGVIDPVTQIAALAEQRGLLCHVDACLGGWLLPWWEELGRPVPPWNFAVPGVTSLSADIHKYGYTFKGASVVLYRDRDLFQRQIFMYDGWPGGLYASSTAAGTRSGSPIAGAWTAISHLGAEGYVRLARQVAAATDGFRAGIEAIDGLRITSDPDLSLFEFGAEEGSGIDIDAVCDVMDDLGWNLDRQQGGLHMMVAPGHAVVVEEFLDDLRTAVTNHGEARGGEHVYGGVV